MIASRFLLEAIYCNGEDLNFCFGCIHFDMPIRHLYKDAVSAV